MIDFNTLLTTDQRVEFLTRQIQQFAQEAYRHSLNKQVAEAANPTTEQGVADKNAAIADSSNALEILDNAIVTYQAELDTLTAV